VSEIDHNVPPVGEEIHLPGPSLLPLINAAGITLIVIGTTIFWLYSLIGAVIFIVSTLIWVRSTRREVDELPEEHAHH
jgi:hypothetical protein